MSEENRFHDVVTFEPTAIAPAQEGYRACYVFEEDGTKKACTQPIVVWALGVRTTTPHVSGKPNPNDEPTKKNVVVGLVLDERIGDLERADLASNFLCYLAPGEQIPEDLEL